MTYILGFQRKNFNAIISDTRITTSSPDKRTGSNSQLKSGLLFPGCIFGRAGNEFQSRAFILDFKEQIENTQETVESKWNKFISFSKPYISSKYDFQILLSVRLGKSPSFFLFDSISGLSKLPHAPNEFVSYGSGKHYLDQQIKNKYTKRLKIVGETIEAQGLPKEIDSSIILSHLICLWLSELSLTFERSTLEEKYDVGGAFHFMYQNINSEYAQYPSVYVYSSADRDNRKISSWVFRIKFGQGCMIIDKHSPGGATSGEVICSDASRKGIGKVDINDLKKEANNIMDRAPYYNFCGFGFTDPQERYTYGFNFSSIGEKGELFDEQGNLLRRWRKLIEHNFNQAGF
jgi:hypothetical protein